MPSSPARYSLLMRIAVAGSVVLVIIALGAFWYASRVAQRAPAKATDNTVTVTIQNNVCEPNEITVPAGHTTFTIVNQSQRALEWEILDGVMVVEERENIAPGFSQSMTVKLEPGQFAITCGLLSNPRGVLHVTPSSASQAEAARPSLVRYIGALAEYKVYLAIQSKSLKQAAGKLSDAISANDTKQAQAAYPAAHQAYKRIEPMAALFADLDTRLDARAQYFEKREADPGFAGFHRLYNGLQGEADLHALVPVASQLTSDIATLDTRLHDLSLQPQQLAGSASKVLRRISENLVASNDASDSDNVLTDLQGTWDGTKKIADLLAPLLLKAAPALQKDIDQQFAALNEALTPYREGDGFKRLSLDQAQRKALAAPVHALADDFGKINAALGLE